MPTKKSLSEKIVTHVLTEADAELDSKTRAKVVKHVESLLGTVKVKRKKDPSAPKRPTSSYLFFCADARPVVKSKHPDMENVEVTKKLGELWRALSDKKKEPYVKKAQKDKERYTREMASYSKSPTTPVEEPKKKVTAYSVFSGELRRRLKESNPKISGKELTKQVSSAWKKLPKEKKVAFEARC